MKRNILILFLVVLLCRTVLAQQPFEEYGYKVKVATLSKGKYQEFFDQDSLVQIGSVIIDQYTGKIVSFVTVDTVYSEATLQPELVSRWLSPDPLSERYYSLSPYNYGANNPIRYSDPTGLAPNDVILQGPEKQKAFAQLQSAVKGQLNLSMDKNGKVSYTQTNSKAALSADAKQLTTAIDDHSVVVKVNATTSDFNKDGKVVPVGSFEGNTVTKNADGTTVETKQQVNPDAASKMDSYAKRPGATMLHEVTESYLGGKFSQKEGVSSPDAGTGHGEWIYKLAHSIATDPAGDLEGTVIKNSNGTITVHYSIAGSNPKVIVNTVNIPK